MTYSEYVCSFRYPIFKAHEPYCHLWLARFYNIFSHYVINGMLFRKKISWIGKVCCDCFYNFVWNISHSKKNFARYYRKYTQVFMQSTRYSCQILIKLKFSRQIFKKYSNIKFNENPSGGNRAVPSGRAEKTDRQTDRQTDRHNEANNRFS